MTTPSLCQREGRGELVENYHKRMISSEYMSRIYNQHTFIERRQLLRKKQTDAERKMWFSLRGRRFHLLRFIRQYSVSKYILDFYCPEKKVAIELDGSQHRETIHLSYDKKRLDILTQYGIHVVRYWDNDVLSNIDGVLVDLFRFIETIPD